MTSKSSCIGVTAGIIAGVVIGGAIGIAVKKMMKPKSAMRKTFSAALEICFPTWPSIPAERKRCVFACKARLSFMDLYKEGVPGSPELSGI